MMLEVIGAIAITAIALLAIMYPGSIALWTIMAGDRLYGIIAGAVVWIMLVGYGWWWLVGQHIHITWS